MSARLLCLALILTSPLVSADQAAPLRIALEQQAQHKSVSVKIKQTKKIPALTEDIVLTGHLWLVPGQAFRWQLGEPLVQSAVYNGTSVFLMDEKKKTATALAPEDRRAKPLLLMLGFGDGASFEKLQEAFIVSSTTTVGEHFVVSLMPKGSVKRALASMVMQINTRTSFPERIEWTQKDGTVVVTEFYPPAIDKTLPAGIFEVKREAYAWE